MTAAHCLDGRFPDMPFRVVIGASERGSDSNGTDSDREDTVNIAAAYLVRHRIKLRVTVVHNNCGDQLAQSSDVTLTTGACVFEVSDVAL